MGVEYQKGGVWLLDTAGCKKKKKSVNKTLVCLRIISIYFLLTAAYF